MGPFEVKLYVALAGLAGICCFFYYTTLSASPQIEEKEPIDLIELGRCYSEIKNITLKNIETLKADESGDLINPNFKQADVGKCGQRLSYENNDQKYSLILGEISGTSFYPSITEDILNLHGNINFMNAVGGVGKPVNKEALIPLLQDITIRCAFLEKFFPYLKRKHATTKQKFDLMKQKQPQEKTDALIDSLALKDFQNFQAELAQSLNGFIKSFPDQQSALKSLEKIREPKDYLSMTQEVEDIKKHNINDYHLPAEYAEPYLKYLAKMQGDAIAEEYVRKRESEKQP
ncbi:MAG: hypothetical protein R3E13_10125 [Alphaproteobacteria bacterium]